ncbi:MAG TPA: sialate O-acetylesterase [Rariglobus sp.]|jgi:sialate O-acetylesterase|nr:sialate O-acetylesterase [Rariglobus sp.]
MQTSVLSRASLAATILLAIASLAKADVHPASLFGDHMVLQEETKVPVWGKADPGEKVSVTFAGQTVTTVAGADGAWRVDLLPLKTDANGQSLTITGKNSLTFSDVLVGEVWIASGQSNMAFGLTEEMHAHDAIAQADDPQLRLFQVPYANSLEPKAELASVGKNDRKGSWCPTTATLFKGPGPTLNFSAVAYYFAREIRVRTGKPVGVIGTYVGGTAAQAWTSIDGIKHDPVLAHYLDEYQKAVADYPKQVAEFPAKNEKFKAQQKAWYDTDEGKAFSAAMAQWNKDKAAVVANGGPQPKRPDIPKSYPAHGPATPGGGSRTPTVLFNAMVQPLIPCAFKGVIWYQGESNGDTLPPSVEYAHTFPNMITDWRAHWGRGDFPFYFVLLANYRAPATTPSQDNWPWVREGQLAALKLPNTATGSAIDVGDDKTIHPLDKLDVGQRLSLPARALVYGEKTLTYSGPAYEAMRVEGNTIRLAFKHLGGGLILGTPPPSSGNPHPVTATELKGFGIAGADQNFVWAKAVIDGNTVVVSSDTVPHPVAVRYDWADNPAGNLYNKEGLPANPFRTDDWAPAQPAPKTK